mgnify:CR=1 FL=1
MIIFGRYFILKVIVHLPAYVSCIVRTQGRQRFVGGAVCWFIRVVHFQLAHLILRELSHLWPGARRVLAGGGTGALEHLVKFALLADRKSLLRFSWTSFFSSAFQQFGYWSVLIVRNHQVHCWLVIFRRSIGSKLRPISLQFGVSLFLSAHLRL